MDENRSPQDFLNEIFERSQMHDPAPPSGRPAGGDRNGAGGSPLPWLCVALGAAALVLGVCLFQMSGLDRRLDALGEEHAALQAEREALERKLAQEQARGAELEQTSQQHWANYLRQLSWNDHSNLLDLLEQFVGAGDYLMAAVMIQDTDIIFNRHHTGWNNEYLTPSQERQYLALRKQALTSGTGLRVLQNVSWPATPGGAADHTGGGAWAGDYKEEVMILEGAFSPEALDAAGTLCSIFRSYAIDPFEAAQAISEALGPDGPAAERLADGTFKPSTVERFERIKAALVEDGFLREEEDGALTVVYRYGGSE